MIVVKIANHDTHVSGHYVALIVMPFVVRDAQKLTQRRRRMLQQLVLHVFE
jgi:membrane associated rhomboid family serine protease